MKINHIAIAVENLDTAVSKYRDALDVKDIEFETVESEGVQVAILHLENANIELMEPTSDSSPIKKFLEKRGSGLHHIALETPNIEGEVSRMEGCGIQFLGKIRDGSAGTKVTFIHPKSMNGVLTELCSNG
uniref:Glyoxalase/bleomycin resistance protein/dioxygenase (MCEE, epi) n=1 Tax=uncultured marine thaumarchaeote KM3_11_E10 TaxID=1455991 RepID=A0A075G734_9ARCH|nr:glyoxalase/bleomycin resistance protein/dioxygenase (MCEE, epi) [uncultured marine thaumarchaeote KM3_11_E10]